MELLCSSWAFIAGGFFLFYRRFTSLLVQISQQQNHDLLHVPSSCSRCVVGYFSAHFLQIPDIRFLPPLLFSLILILFADTLAVGFGQAGYPLPLLHPPSRPRRDCEGQARGRGIWAVLILYGCIVAVIFGTTRADNWFRFNNMGYESMPGLGSLGRSTTISNRVTKRSSTILSMHLAWVMRNPTCTAVRRRPGF